VLEEESNEPSHLPYASAGSLSSSGRSSFFRQGRTVSA
jgi:hypothetical protein